MEGVIRGVADALIKSTKEIGILRCFRLLGFGFRITLFGIMRSFRLLGIAHITPLGILRCFQLLGFGFHTTPLALLYLQIGLTHQCWILWHGLS